MSKSTSVSTQTTSAQDNRVAADTGATALGNNSQNLSGQAAVVGGNYTLSEQVPPQFINLVGDLSNLTQSAINTTNSAYQTALSAQAAPLSTPQNNITKYIPLIIGAIVVYEVFKK